MMQVVIDADEITPHAIEECVEVMEIDGLALRFFSQQTPEICMAAVKQNPDVLHHIISHLTQ